MEENHYYPFGLKHGAYNQTRKDVRYKEQAASKKEVKQVMPEAVKFKYLYNAKELQDELGLNWYDFETRNYDASLARWMNIDPFAHNYMRHSPYSYTLNNPINNLDINGNFVLPKQFIEAYPRLAQYLKNGIQEIANNPRVMSALRKNGHFTNEEIIEHLTWNKGADIYVTQLGYGPKGIRPINGKYYPGEDKTSLGKKSTTLLIDIDLVEALEKASGRKRDYYLFLVAATILHELTHYGDDRADNPFPYDYEEGNHFEIDAYGQLVKNINDAKYLVDKYLSKQKKKQKENKKKGKSAMKLINFINNNFDNIKSGTTYIWDGDSWVVEQ